MKLYLLQQDINNQFDSYDSCIVAANNENEARTIHPATLRFSKGQTLKESNELEWNQEDRFYFMKIGNSWLPRKERHKIKVTYIGEADKRYTEAQCILASYNAG